MTIRTTIRTFLLAASIVAQAPAWAGGIPTYDIQTWLQLKQQSDQLRSQFDTLRQQFAAITGSYGRGQTGLSDSIRASSVVPGSWQDVVALQRNGAFASKQTFYETLIKTLPQDVFQDPNARNATTYRMSTDSVRAALAGGDVLYTEVQTHLTNLAQMSQQVDTTANIKDGQDLQNRIATENGMLQSAMAKLNAMNMNLQANMLNQQNQATAATQRYFRRSTQ